jgi:LemA protein
MDKKQIILASLLVGIGSILVSFFSFFGTLLGVVGLIFSIIALGFIKKDFSLSNLKIQARIGLITSLISIIILPFYLFIMMYRNTYNTAISLQESVDKSWGDVGASYQRRADLVPQLVATVKGAAANEKDILTRVTNARAGIVNAKTPDDMEMMGKEINTAINLAFEAYPQIRSTENFAGLQAQLEGTENRINKARTDYNEAVQQYNSHIRGFFNSMFLNKETFPKKEAFKAASGSEVAPTVSFE